MRVCVWPSPICYRSALFTWWARLCHNVMSLVFDLWIVSCRWERQHVLFVHPQWNVNKPMNVMWTCCWSSKTFYVQTIITDHAYCTLMPAISSQSLLVCTTLPNCVIKVICLYNPTRQHWLQLSNWRAEASCSPISEPSSTLCLLSISVVWLGDMSDPTFLIVTV